MTETRFPSGFHLADDVPVLLFQSAGDAQHAQYLTDLMVMSFT
jgi:hypothetical protein